MMNYQSALQLKKLARIIERAGTAKGTPLQLGEALDALAKSHGFEAWSALAPRLSAAGVETSLAEHELRHMHVASQGAESGDSEYGPECTVQAHTGFILTTPAYPAECDYVRICDPIGREVSYWTAQEWQEAPQEVMGAIVGALNRNSNLDAPRPSRPAQEEPNPLPPVRERYWPCDERMSRKQLRHQIGLMNFEMTAIRKMNDDLVRKSKGQAQELQKRQSQKPKAPMFWKIVPDVADEAMKSAAHARLKFDGTFVASFIYDAMLKAAPNLEN